MALKTDARLGLGGKQAGTIGSDSGAAGGLSVRHDTTSPGAVKSTYTATGPVAVQLALW